MKTKDKKTVKEEKNKDTDIPDFAGMFMNNDMEELKNAVHSVTVAKTAELINTPADNSSSDDE